MKPVLAKKIILLCVGLFATPLFAQWTVDENDKASSSEQAIEVPVIAEMTEEQAKAFAEFEAAKCSNGGPKTKAFMDFSTQDPLEASYIQEVAQAFAAAIQKHSLAPDLSQTDARSVRFLFELDRQGAVKSITVYSQEGDTGLKQFVTQLISLSVPFPSFESVVDECYETLVISAILDF